MKPKHVTKKKLLRRLWEAFGDDFMDAAADKLSFDTLDIANLLLKRSGPLEAKAFIEDRMTH